MDQNEIQDRHVQQVSPSYDKLASMIDTRNRHNEDAVLKSYFKKQGLDVNETQREINKYKENRTKTQKAKEREVQRIFKENTILRNKVMDAEIRTHALMQNVDPQKMKSLFRIIDRVACMDNDGNPVIEKLKVAISEATKEFPNLIRKQEGFIQIGAPKIRQSINPKNYG